MNTTTWLNEQARTVRIALMNGGLIEARNALRFVFEDDSMDKRIRPVQIIRLAAFPMSL